jgi:hypothetical protein
MADDTSTQAPKDFMGFLEFYLVKKAPFQIPDEIREWLVKFGPWIAVVLLVLSAPLVLFALGLGTAFLPIGGYGYATAFGTAAIGLLAHFALMAFALPGLFARKMVGWTLMFYAQIANAVASILAGNVLTALVGALISFYVMFQIRGKYKN